MVFRMPQASYLMKLGAATVRVLLYAAHQAGAAVATLLRLERPGAEAGHRDIRRGALAPGNNVDSSYEHACPPGCSSPVWMWPPRVTAVNAD